MRLIDADVLYETLCHVWDRSDSEEFEQAVFKVIANAPTADRPTGEWISEELANMICNEICYYKEVTVDADSLNDLCEGCLIKKMKYDRPTGEWIEEITGNGWNEWVNLTCDQCGLKFKKAGAWQYCPHCGSRNER